MIRKDQNNKHVVDETTKRHCIQILYINFEMCVLFFSLLISYLIYLNMFHTLIKNGVASNLNSINIVAMHQSEIWENNTYWQVTNKIILVVVEVVARYSTSIDDQETTTYFLLF